METEAYNILANELNNLKAEFKRNRQNLIIDYVKKVKKYNVGQIVKNKNGQVGKIQKVSYGWTEFSTRSETTKPPDKITYIVLLYTKKLKPRLDGETIYFNEEDIIELMDIP